MGRIAANNSVSVKLSMAQSCQIAVFAGLIFLASEQIVYYKRLWWVPLALLFATEAAIRRESQLPPTIAVD